MWPEITDWQSLYPPSRTQRHIIAILGVIAGMAGIAATLILTLV